DFAEGPGTGERDADGAEQTGVEQADGHERPEVAVLFHEQARGLGGVVHGNAVKHRSRHDDDEDRHHDREDRPDESVELAEWNVLLGQSLVDHGGLLEEQHPGRDGGADIGHQEEKQFAVEAAREIGNQAVNKNVRDLRVNHEGAGNIDQVQGAEPHGDLFPGPVTAIEHDEAQKQTDDDHRHPGGNAENVERRGHADEFGDQRQPIDQQQVQKGKPAP